MNGFRKFGLRWWRRNLLRTLRVWREKHHPVDKSLIVWFEGSRGRNRRPHSLFTQNLDGTYDWKEEIQGGTRGTEPVRKRGTKLKVLRYCSQMRKLRLSKDGVRAFKIALDRLERAAGPYERD